MIFYLEVFLKLCLTFILAALFGYDRQKAHKPIGLGTYIFVALGSCSLGITAHSLYSENPLPLLAAIITGVGFLGAGALIKTSDKVFGFSSAASIWIFAIIGLIVGVGEYYVAILTFLLVWVVIAIDRWLEIEGIGSYQRKLLIVTNRLMPEKDIEAVLLIGSVKAKKIRVEVDKKENTISVLYQLEGRKDDINHIPQRLYEKGWFKSFKVE